MFALGETKEVSLEIDRIYRRISSKPPDSPWTHYNGRTDYNLCAIDTTKLVQNLLKTRDNVYVLDLGCGDASWSKELAEKIDKGTLHIVNVRGEPFRNSNTIHTKRCHIYFLGRFKIEEFSEELKRFNLPNYEGFDLVVSRWTLRHLVHPLNTFRMVFNSLRINGLFLFDGFYFQFPSAGIDHSEMCLRLNQFFLSLNIPFLSRYFRSDKSLDQFIIQRKTPEECTLRFKYSKIVNVHKIGVNAKRIIEVIPLYQPLPSIHKSVAEDEICGNEDLFKLITKMQVWNRTVKWKKKYPLHRAVRHGDFASVKTLLKAGISPNTKNDRGATPLYIAAGTDFSGRIVQLLIDFGANKKIGIDRLFTPLYKAELVVNRAAIRLLLKETW